MNASGGVPTNTSSGVGANEDGGNVSQIASTSRWKCIVPFGRPVVPEVNAIMHTSSDAVSTLSNVSRCFAMRADRLAGPSSCESTTVVRLGHDGRAASSSSMSRLSQIACVISAAVMTSTSSLARSSGIVVTTTQPAFTTPSQHAAMTSLLKPRSSTRLPGMRPRSLSSTFAMRLASASNSLYVMRRCGVTTAGRLPKPFATVVSSNSAAQFSIAGYCSSGRSYKNSGHCSRGGR